MIAASHNAQGWSRAGAGEAPGCGVGMRPATVAVHQLERPTRSEKPRVHCRGSGTPRTFFSIARRITAHRRLGCSSSRLSRRPQFTPVSIDPDEIHELRICELTGRQAVLSRALLSSAGAMSGNYSEPVRLGWRRFLPLLWRATAAKAISRWAGALADWICLPEEQEPTPMRTTTSGNTKGGASK